MSRRIAKKSKAHESFLKEVGQRIAESRMKLGLSQYQLAKLSELSQQQISYAERGEKGLRCENMLRVAEVLNVSIDYLLTGRGSEHDLSLMLAEMKDDLEGLTVEQRATLCEVIHLFIKTIRKIDSESNS